MGIDLTKDEMKNRVLNYLDYLSEKEIHITIKDTQTSSDSHKELIQIGGKSQVPCLVIDGQALYESTDIINWFEEHYS